VPQVGGTGRKGGNIGRPSRGCEGGPEGVGAASAREERMSFFSEGEGGTKRNRGGKPN